jgi:hypothetical protein
MTITEASKELYQSLRKFDEVVGTGVVTNDNSPYIVVYIEKATKVVLDKIPKIYKGNNVKTEISSPFFSF